MAGSAEPDAAVLEGWLDALFVTSSVAMAVISTFEGRYLKANDAFLELLGLSRDELFRADPFELGHRITHAEDIPREQELFAELSVGARRSYTLDKRFVRSDGSFRWARLTFTAIAVEAEAPVSAQNPIRFVVMHIVDLQEQKELAQALARRDEELRHAQKVDGIGRLAAGIAHDFNNLLTVIIGHASVLKDTIEQSAKEGETASLGEDVDEILAASDRAAALTAQILAHGRREGVVPRVFPLSDAVEPLRRMLVRTIGSNIQVDEDLAARGAIFADAGQVGQIVMNLMLNARDAMPDGGRIGLSTRDLSVPAGSSGVPGPGEWVALSVTDTGHGMTAEVQARMFEPFFTTRGNRPGTQGTGLGLATVRRIADERGARIQVESAPGAGTRVTVFFPRVESSEPADRRAKEHPLAASSTGQRVLIVEDEPSVRSLVASLLLGARYRVTVARNGEEALRLIDSDAEAFDLIVTDLMMPSVGGARLAEVLENRGRRSRLLFISGYANMTPAELLPHGNLLPKPFTPTQLLTAVRDALK